MKILTFSQAADLFRVRSATISRWVKDGKLKQGPKAGKQKTLTQESVDALASDSTFQIGRESAKNNQGKKRKITQKYANQKEMEELKQRIEKLENLIMNLSEEFKNIRKVTQNNANKGALIQQTVNNEKTSKTSQKNKKKAKGSPQKAD